MVNQRLDEALAVIHRIYTKTVLPEGDCVAEVHQSAVHAIAWLSMAMAIPQTAPEVGPLQGLKAAPPAHDWGPLAHRHCIHINWPSAGELCGAESHAGTAWLCLLQEETQRAAGEVQS